MFHSSRRITPVSSDTAPLGGYSGVGAPAAHRPLLADAYLAIEESTGMPREVAHQGVLRTELSDDEYRPIAVGLHGILVAVINEGDVLAAKTFTYETMLEGMIEVGVLSRQRMFLQRCVLALDRFNTGSLASLGVTDIDMGTTIKSNVAIAFDEVLNKLRAYACLDLVPKHALTDFSDSMRALQGYFLLRSTVISAMERLAREELDTLQRFATHDQIGALNSGQFFVRRALISWLLQALFLRSRGSALAEPSVHSVYIAAGAGVVASANYYEMWLREFLSHRPVEMEGICGLIEDVLAGFSVDGTGHAGYVQDLIKMTHVKELICADEIETPYHHRLKARLSPLSFIAGVGFSVLGLSILSVLAYFLNYYLHHPWSSGSSSDVAFAADGSLALTCQPGVAPFNYTLAHLDLSANLALGAVTVSVASNGSVVFISVCGDNPPVAPVGGVCSYSATSDLARTYALSLVSLNAGNPFELQASFNSYPGYILSFPGVFPYCPDAGMVPYLLNGIQVMVARAIVDEVPDDINLTFLLGMGLLILAALMSLAKPAFVADVVARSSEICAGAMRFVTSFFSESGSLGRSDAPEVTV